MSFIKRVFRKTFTSKRIAIMSGFFILGIGIIVVFDQVVMPWYTKHGESLVVPNTIAKRFEDAKDILEIQGLEAIKAGEMHDSDLPFGYVVDQNPRPHRLVKKGRRVYLTISAGEKEVQVPDLYGISETNAKERLKSFGLRIGEIFYEYVPNELSDVVIDQSKPVNSLIKSSETIDITVSLGAPTENVTVPSLLGILLEPAKREITKSGLVLGQIKFKVNNNFLPTTVIDQSLEAGTNVSFGDRLDLVITAVSQ